MRLSKKKVEKIKAAIAAGTKQPEIAKRVQGQPLRSCRTLPRAACIKTCRGRTASRRSRSRPAASTRRIPDYDPTNTRIMELEAEVVHLTEERNRERAKVKASAKIAGLFKAVVGEMEQRVKPFAALPPALDFRRKAADRRALRHAHERRPPRSGRAARGSRRPGRLQLSRFLCPCRAVRGHRRRMDPGHPGAEVLLSGAVGAGLRRLHQRRNPQGVRAVLLPQPVQELPGHRPASRPDVPRPGGPLRAGPRPVSGGQPRPADAEEGLPRGERQLGLPRRRGGPAALPRNWATSTSPSPMRGAPTSTSTASASTSVTATTFAATWASPGTGWSAGKRA